VIVIVIVQNAAIKLKKEKLVGRAKKKGKVSKTTERARLNEKRDDPRWHKLMNEYYDLCDDLGVKIDKNLPRSISIEALTEVVELLKEKHV